MLPGRKIVHAFPGNARVENSKESLYEFTVISIDNLEKTPIQHTYSPVLLPDSLIDNYMIDRDNQNLYSKVRDILREYPYYPPIRSITTDAEFIFVSTYHRNNNGDILTDVFSAESYSHVSSAYFSIAPTFIKNGYAYRIAKNSEGFYEVVKYKIDPAVYVK